jgi:hypothetical protein
MSPPQERPTESVIEHVQPNQLPQNSFDSFFDAETATALNKPWLNLERGARLQRFRVFADEYPNITEEERGILYRILVKANDAKMLNTKQQVLYEGGKIVSIRGLKQTGGNGVPILFKIEQVRPTKKKRDESKA